MFVVSLSYKKDFSEVDKYIAAHMEYINKYYQQEKFVVSGRKEPRTGGIILVKNIDREEVDKIIKEDPFYIADVADYDVIEFLPSTVAKGFESLQQNA
jgi:uncharacterized protein YciI